MEMLEAGESYQRCSGCDHVFAFASGSSVHKGQVMKSTQGEAIVLVVDRPFSARCIHVPYPSVSYAYDPRWREEHQLAPFFSSHISRTTPLWSSHVSRLQKLRKPIFLYFRGTIHDSSVTNTRHRLWKFFQSHGVLRDTSIVFTNQSLATKEDYLLQMKDSQFCLVPRGKTPGSQRFTEAVLMGCIPVVVSDDFRPPFADTTGESYMVRVAERELTSVIDKLRALPFARIQDMQLQLSKLWEMFAYPPIPNSYGALSQILLRIIALLDKNESKGS